jgi:DNA invertase Pin-like site-specific DNA recombinase
MKIEQRKPKIYGYARASTARQSESPETQKDLIRKYATFLDMGDVSAIFVDAGVSGKVPIGERAAGKELIRTLKPGDSLVISRLDRAFRKLKDCVEVLEDFRRRSIKLYICNMGGMALDLTSPMGTFMIHILAAFAELEREYNSERVKEGIARRKREYVRHTRFPGYGFRWEKQRDATGKVVRRRVPDVEERALMKKIAGWRIAVPPQSWQQIADHFREQGLITKDGEPWSKMRIIRVCQAEFQLQLKEQRASG